MLPDKPKVITWALADTVNDTSIDTFKNSMMYTTQTDRHDTPEDAH